MEITIAWWNTSMSPPTTNKKAKANKKTPENFLIVLKFLLENEGVDLLGLCEVDQADIAAIDAMLSVSGLGDYNVVSLYSTKSNRVNDFCLVLNSTKLQFVEHAFVENWDEAKIYYKVGVRAKLVLADSSQLNVFLSHWQSKKSMNNPAHRAHLGRYLRDSINTVFQVQGPAACVVAMGDYNDDPFDDSMIYHLKSTRDKSFVLANPKMLYNPFWRVMGALIPHADGVKEEWNYPSGTCHYRENKEHTYWKTFDQILFSSSFFGASQWHLAEESTRIYSLLEFGAYFQDWAVVSDHLPVATKISRASHV